MQKLDTEVVEDFEKPNGEIGKRKATRQDLEFQASPSDKDTILAIYAARMQDAERDGYTTLRTEIIGDTLRVRIGNVHPGHVQKLEQAFAPHEKPAQATPKV